MGVLALVVGWAPSMPVVTGSIPGGGIIWPNFHRIEKLFEFFMMLKIWKKKKEKRKKKKIRNDKAWWLKREKDKNCLKIEKMFENKEKEKNRCAGLSWVKKLVCMKTLRWSS